MRHRIFPILLIVIISFMATLLAHSYQGLKGDVNGDSTVNILDALKGANFILQIDILDEQEFWRADCNSPSGRCDGDSVVNILDVIRIVNILLGVGSCATVDLDGNIYYTMMIGTQEWMTENLKVTHYRNGDTIPEAINWGGLSTGAYCNYGNDGNNVAIYGRLYNWYAVNDLRDLAPEGCHVPSDAEWKQLEMYLGMSQSQANAQGLRGTDEGGKMKEVGTSHWNRPNMGATNASGFTALPAGFRDNQGDFYTLGYYAYFWSSTESHTSYAWYRYLSYNYSDVYRYVNGKRCGFSVRCIRDKDAPTASFTVNPLLGDTNTVFNVDASGSTDFQDSTSCLQVRWDWENDGMYDTDWSTIKTASHIYTTVGTKTITLEVKDTGGLTDTETGRIKVCPSECATVTDIDGNTYVSIKIGCQCWMAENLKVTHYRNGDPIPNVTSRAEWSNLSGGAYCNYNNDTSDVATYGRLYNWYAVDDSRNIAPEGWHVPTDEEWKELEMYLGMSQSDADSCCGWRGTNEGGKLKEAGYSHWWNPNTGATNESGFTALPAGYRYPDGLFSYPRYDAYFWSATDYGSNEAWYRYLMYEVAWVLRSYLDNRSGFSLRCVRD